VGGLEQLDAVTLDLYGTLVTLIDPVPRLVELLREHGVERAAERVTAAFEEELSYYSARSDEGRDDASVADLNERCAAVFLTAVEAELPAREFAPLYVDALRFELMPGALEALDGLRSRGLDLAAVTNWDVTVHNHLAELGLTPYFSSVVTAAETGARKPDPALFRRTLELLGVEPARAAHVGDSESDREGAHAAGMRFEPPPVSRLLGERS